MQANPSLPAPPPRRLGDWILGPDPQQRLAIKRLGLRVPTFVVAHSLQGLATWLGLMPAWQMWLLGLYSLIGLFMFYALLRSGMARPLPDPTLTFPQTLFTVSAIVLAYGVAPSTRAAALLLLCLLFVFDMQRLRPRQITLAAFGSLGMLAATLAGIWWFAPHGVDLRAEALNIGMACVLVPILSMVGAEVQRVRRRQLKQKTELAQTLERLHELSTRDGLTGLYNRRHLLKVYEEEASRQRRTHRPFCVALLDLDHFKRINDNFGHAVGDAVLRDFAQLAREALRNTDLLGRWGGEEFLLLLPETPGDQAQVALARLRERVATHAWQAHADGLQVSFSAGLTAHHALDATNQAIERADTALYAAKAQGRDRTVLA